MTKRRNDRGYSLVEMIIVIAIVAVVAGMALISITLIHSARAKEAAVTVDTEVATLITKSKNMQVELSGTGINKSEWQYAARIYADDAGVYYFQKGFYNSVSRTYDFSHDLDQEGKGVSLSSYVQIKLTGSYKTVAWTEGSKKGVESDSFSSANETLLADLDNNKGGFFIRFAKDGVCEAGYGDLGFYKRNGTVVAHEYIRKNGSHQSK